jgi:hypothetical protein
MSRARRQSWWIFDASLNVKLHPQRRTESFGASNQLRARALVLEKPVDAIPISK